MFHLCGLRICLFCQDQAFILIFFLIFLMGKDGKQTCRSHLTPSTDHVNTTVTISEPAKF